MTVHGASGSYLWAQKSPVKKTPPPTDDVSREEFDAVRGVQDDQEERLAKVELQLRALLARAAHDDAE